MKFIKIYGERNTGTTYLTGLIRRNIVCKVVKSRPPFWLRKIHKLIPNNNEILRDLYFSIRKNKKLLYLLFCSTWPWQIKTNNQ